LEPPSPGIIYIGSACSTAPHSTKVTAHASDAESGIKSVVLKWTDSAGVPKQKTMTSVGSGTYEVVLNSTEVGPAPNGTNLQATAKNGANLTANSPTARLFVNQC